MITAGRDPLVHPLTRSPLDALALSQRIHQTNRDGPRLQAILNAYPCSAYLLGPPQLQAIGQRYLGHCYPALPLEQLPWGLANWLRWQPQCQPMLEDYPFLLTLMRWESAWHKAYYCDRWTPVDGQQLQQGCTQHQLMPQLALNSGLSVVRSCYNIDEIWQALNQLRAGEEVEVAVTATAATTWLCYPSEHSQHWQQLTKQEMTQLARLRQELTRKEARQTEIAQRIDPQFIAVALNKHWLVKCGS